MHFLNDLLVVSGILYFRRNGTCPGDIHSLWIWARWQKKPWMSRYGFAVGHLLPLQVQNRSVRSVHWSLWWLLTYPLYPFMLIGSWHIRHINCESPGKASDPYNWSHSHSTIHRIHMLCLASWWIYTRFGLWYSRWTNYSNPASMSCGLPPVPQISTLWFRIFVPDLDFFSSIRRSKPNPKNNIVIGGAGGYWITRVWIIRPSAVSRPVSCVVGQIHMVLG